MEARETLNEVLNLTSHTQLLLRIGYIKLYCHIPYMPLGCVSTQRNKSCVFFQILCYFGVTDFELCLKVCNSYLKHNYEHNVVGLLRKLNLSRLEIPAFGFHY